MVHKKPKNTGPSGFLPVNKPSGITSFDVIRELRRILKIRKLGHSGVLDKPAMGVLVVGANRATRLFELFHGFDKLYEAELWFGLSTNTDDLSGELLEAGPEHELDEEALSSAIHDYTGTIDQFPPAFSLTKVGGKELYRYALEGEEIEARPKRVTVLDSELLEVRTGIDPREAVAPDSPLAEVADKLPPLSCARVQFKCVGGVYVRSLARDIGADLGLRGALGRLVRLNVGPFTIEQSLELEDVARAMDDTSDPVSVLLPLGSIAPDAAQLRLDMAQLKLVRNGRAIRRFKHHLPPLAEKRGDTVYGMDPGGNLVVILSVGNVNEHGLVDLKPEKVLS